MTILFAYINEKQAAVASDGNIVSKDNILPQSQDKTFSLYNGLVVGCFSNNMSIDNASYGTAVSIGLVIKKISEDIQTPDNFDRFIDLLINSYLEILNSPKTTAPPIEQRSSNILLASSKNFDGKDFQIYRLIFGFCAVRREIIFSKKDGPCFGVGKWFVVPPDEEFQKIHKAIQESFNEGHAGLSIEEIVKKGIRIGICTSTIMKGHKKFLGGGVYSKLTRLEK